MKLTTLVRVTVHVLLTCIGLSACASLQVPPIPNLSPTSAPSPASEMVDGFVHQIDGEFGYSVFRPSNWASHNFGSQRLYFPPHFFPFGETTDDWFYISIVNIQSLAEDQGVEIAEMSLFQADPTLDSWTQGLEEYWQRSGLNFQMEETLSNAKIYSISRSPEWYLAAFVVEGAQPLMFVLNGNGIYTDVDTLREVGLYDDFTVMVSSLIPTNSDEVTPPLTEIEGGQIPEQPSPSP